MTTRTPDAETPGAAGPAAGVPGAPADAAPPSRGRNLYLWAFLLGIVVLTLVRPCLRRVPEPPPVQGRLPAFTFVDDAGRPFGPERLKGTVWIVHVFYLACGDACAGPLKSLAEIRHAYAEFGVHGIGVLSLSIDPGRDRPEALRAFETASGADPGRWLVATGDAGVLESFARGVFGPRPGGPLGTGGEAPPPAGTADDPPLGWLARSGMLALVDPDGGLRGVYRSDASGIDEIYNRAQRVRELYRP